MALTCRETRKHLLASRARLALPVAFSACLATQPVPAADPVRVASDDWCPYVCASDGKIRDGFLVEVTVKSMALMGYQVEPVLLPLNRAIHLTTSGEVNGVFAPPLDQRLRPGVTLAYSHACFYTRAGSGWTYRGIESISKLRLGVIDDYGYDDGPMDAYIARRRKDSRVLDFSYGATAGNTNVQKLLGGRFPVLLEHALVMRHLTEGTAAAAQLRQAGCLDRPLPLTVGFALHDARSAAWVQALSDGLKMLNSSGELAALRAHYHLAAEAEPRRAAKSGR